MNTSSKRQVNHDGHVQGRHAVVLGGSLAELLAARVLSDHFDEVTLVERDAYKETAEVRRGIPQAGDGVGGSAARAVASFQHDGSAHCALSSTHLPARIAPSLDGKEVS